MARPTTVDRSRSSGSKRRTALPRGWVTALVVGGLVPGVGRAGGGPEGAPVSPRRVVAAAWSADGQFLAVTGADRAGLLVVDRVSGARQPVSTAPGAGRDPAWLGSRLIFKEVTTDGRRRPVMQLLSYEATTGRRLLLRAEPLLGDPSAAAPAALVAVTIAQTLALFTLGARAELELARRFPLPELSSLAALDPGGTRVALSHADGRTAVMRLADGSTTWLPKPAGASHPRWSSDGRLLSLAGPGSRFTVVEVESGKVLCTIGGTNPRWIPGTHHLLFDRARVEEYVTVAADLWRADAESGASGRLTESEALERFPLPSPDGLALAYSELASGALHLAALDGDPSRQPGPPLLLPDALPTPVRDPRDLDDAVLVDVPYMHQRWDTPDDFDGSSSCGPTTALMVIQKYGKLPDIDTTCSWPTAHACPWAYYVPNRYFYGGHLYDTRGSAAGCRIVEGAHGFVNGHETCSAGMTPTGAYSDRMVQFVTQHGVASQYASVALQTVIDEIDAGYALYALISEPAGHYLVIRGYTPEGALVVNDPYGDYNLDAAVPWGSQPNGEAVLYDWPGYNTGHTELTIDHVFTARGPAWAASLVAIDYPSAMQAGEVATAVLQLRNQGSTTWTSESLFVSTAGPLGRTSAFFDAATWLAPDLAATIDATTPPGAWGQCRITLRAPEVTAVTDYAEPWQLVDGSSTAFGPEPAELTFAIRVMPRPANLPPEAEAGEDQTVALGGTAVLDGSGSTDADGQVVAWLWGTPNGVLSGERVAWTPSLPGAHSILLVAQDDRGDIDTDAVVVTVPDPTSPNLPPVAEAGPDRRIRLGQALTLDGTASTDPDGTIVSWRWELSGRTVYGQRADLVPSRSGRFVVVLTVTDEAGLTGTDTANFEVIAKGGDQPAGCRNDRAGGDGLAAGVGVALVLCARRARRRSGASPPPR